jgi:hypothetical protein
MGESRSPYIDSFQFSIALKYNIPLQQAHTINYRKVLKYWQYCNTTKGKVEFILDLLEDERQKVLKKDAGL